jgi:hypothetical protein
VAYPVRVRVKRGKSLRKTLLDYVKMWLQYEKDEKDVQKRIEWYK